MPEPQAKPNPLASLQAIAQAAAAGKQPAALAALAAAGFRPPAATHAEVADWFGVQADTVRTRWTAAGMPRVETGNRRNVYDLADIGRWLFGRRGDAADADTGELRKKKLSAEARIAGARADREEAKVIPIEEHEARVSAVLLLLRDYLRNFAHLSAADFPADPEASAKLNARIGTLLEELAAVAKQDGDPPAE